MAAIILLILLGIMVAGGFLAAFIWAVKSGQYDDDYSPSVRMLFDNMPEREENVVPENMNNPEQLKEGGSESSKVENAINKGE